MKVVVSNRAELEDTLMLAVLDFQAEFMKSNYSHAQVQIFDDMIIEVILTRGISVPTEDELAKPLEGRALFRQCYRAMFDSCRNWLQKRIEHAARAKV